MMLERYQATNLDQLAFVMAGTGAQQQQPGHDRPENEKAPANRGRGSIHSPWPSA
jgi:hypothetical protein